MQKFEADVRYVGVLAGRYTLAALPAAAGAGGDTVFACRTQSLSPAIATVAAPVIGEVGQGVTLLLDHIGFLKGAVRGHVDNGFQVDIAGSDDDRQKLAARITWLKRHRLRQVQDRRTSPRKLPRRPRAMLYVGDEELACFVIDYSSSGAGISAKSRPPLGTRLFLGSISGSVARHMDVGFGLKFDSPLPIEDVEAAIAVQRAAAEAAAG